MEDPTGADFDVNKILEFWKNFDLDGRRLSLDKQVRQFFLIFCFSYLVKSARKSVNLKLLRSVVARD